MPIPLSDYKMPNWVKYKTRYPLSEDKKDRYIQASDPDMQRQFPRGIRQPGYNPNHNSTKVEKINLESEDISLKGR